MKILSIVLLCLICAFSHAQSPVNDQAENLFSVLGDTLLHPGEYKFTDDERANWFFVPRKRNGIPLSAMSPEQRTMALKLLSTSLSLVGYQKATAIISLENVLREVEGRGANDSYRDPLQYYCTFFGDPSEVGFWGWRFEGHHLSLNFTIAHGKIESSTPSFWGSNPATVQSGDQRGKVVLKMEMSLGFQLVQSLSPEQQKVAIISETALPEIVSFNSRKAVPLQPVGINYNALNGDQQKIFMQLLNVYVGNYELGFAEKLTAKIKKAGIEKLSFAWAGSLQPGAGHYYRIQGPMLLIEYDNTQNNANHIHATVRDLTNDFGEDILREHYQQEHH